VGTAFFIAPSILITAGHCVASALKPGVRLIASLPGLAVVDMHELRRGGIAAIKCTVKESLLRSKRKDIAILECGYISPNYLEIGQDHLQPNSIVDIIGYPGDITTAWLLKHPALISTAESKDIAEKLLPLHHLTITRGNIVGMNSTMTYTVSTCRGMSGACVLYGGKAYGIFNLRVFHLTSRSSYRASGYGSGESTYGDAIQG
jgi:V8-like Glu-specific endopeptidase